MKIIFYDFEVFKHDWLVVFRDHGSLEYNIIENDRQALLEFYNKNKNNIFCGFNCKHYDEHIFRAIMCNLNPHDVTKHIIDNKKSGWQYKGMKRIPIVGIDLKMDVQGNPALSLKEAGANMGLSIHESDVPFDIQRKLTDAELEDTKKYCKHDVDIVYELFQARFDEYVKPKLSVINAFDLDIKNISKTSAQLTAMILGASPKRFYDELQYDMPSHIKIENKKILELYNVKELDYNKTYKTDIDGVEHTFAYGGIHGAKQRYYTQGDLLAIDVTSYYPSMMIKYDFISRSLRDRSNYQKIYDKRVQLKKEGNPLHHPYKIIIVATYGAMKNKYNKLYDPKQVNQVCITGQLMLTDLMEKLTPYSTLIQSNTDGILVKVHSREKVLEAVKEWEDRTKMKMEYEDVDRIWQKDVNNYVMVTKKGKVKVKGGWVRSYSADDPRMSFSSNQMSIVGIAIVNYLVYNKPIEDTIEECKDPILFQLVAKKGSTFSHCEIKVKDKFKKINNVNRVFAASIGGGQLFKIKNGSKHMIPNLPEKCFVFNDHLDNFNQMFNIDKQWYINLAYERLKEFGVNNL